MTTSIARPHRGRHRPGLGQPPMLAQPFGLDALHGAERRTVPDGGGDVPVGHLRGVPLGSPHQRDQYAAAHRCGAQPDPQEHGDTDGEQSLGTGRT